MEDNRLKQIVITIALILIVIFAFWTISQNPPIEIPEEVVEIFTPKESKLTPEATPTSTPTPINQTNDTDTWRWIDGGGRTITPPSGVNIAVDGEDPWMTNYSIDMGGMMPGMYATVRYPIKNIGGEPAKIWQEIVVMNETGGEIRYNGVASSESEYTDCGGFTEGYTEKCDLSANLIYNLVASIGETGYIIIDPSEEILVSEIDGTWKYLGKIEVGQTMEVIQGFEMTGETSNWAQGDIMTTNFRIYAVSYDGSDP